MAKINDNYLKLKAGYLFPEIGRRVRAFAEANPQAKVIRLGIGDVTRPLPPAILKAFHDAVDDLARVESFAGYGPEQGYDWLIDTIIAKSYTPLGVTLKSTEMFISDGSKCDCANILDIFALDNTVAIGDPVYPVYNDTNVMIGRKKTPIIMAPKAPEMIRPDLQTMVCLRDTQRSFGCPTTGSRCDDQSLATTTPSRWFRRPDSSRASSRGPTRPAAQSCHRRRCPMQNQPGGTEDPQVFWRIPCQQLARSPSRGQQ
jgi:hypothetical protein